MLVTAVVAVGGWAFVRFLDNVNERFSAADKRVEKRFDTAEKRAEKRFDAADKRFACVENSLQELKVLIKQALPAAR